MATQKGIDVKKMNKIEELNVVDETKQRKNLLLIRLESLEALGIDKETIKKLIEADVVVRHDRMTCGDYNL